MRLGDVAIGRIVLVEPCDDLLEAWRIAPVAHQVAHNVEERDHVDAGVAHVVVANVADEGRRGARGLGIGPDAVALGAERACKEGGACRLSKHKYSARVSPMEIAGAASEGGLLEGKRTNIRHDACHDDLLPARRPHGGAEIGIIPRIDLPLAFDQRHVGIHLADGPRKRAVGP